MPMVLPTPQATHEQMVVSVLGGVALVVSQAPCVDYIHTLQRSGVCMLIVKDIILGLVAHQVTGEQLCLFGVVQAVSPFPLV